MKPTIPVSLRIPLVLGLSSWLTGCGLELLGTVQRLQTQATTSKSGLPLGALPSWPVSLKVGLGEVSATLGEFVKPGEGDLPLLEMEDGRYEVRLKPITFAGFDLGKVLSAGTPTRDIPIPTRGLSEKTPDAFTTPTVTKTLEELKILEVTIPDPINQSIGTILELSRSADPVTANLARNITLPSPLTFPTTGDIPLDIGPITLGTTSRIALGASSKVVIPIRRDIGGPGSTDKLVPIVSGLRIESDKRLINKTWLDANPTVTLPADGFLEIPLDEGAVIAKDLEIHGGIRGTLLPGFRPVDLDNAQQISLEAGTVSVQIARFSLGRQASGSFNIPPVAQDFTDKFQALEDQGVQSPSDVTIGTGSIEVRVNNGFGLSSRIGFTVKGLEDSAGRTFQRAIFIPGTTRRGEPRIATRSISLAGAVLKSANIEVIPEVETIDTDERAIDIQNRYGADFDRLFPDAASMAQAARDLEVADGLAIFDGSAQISGTISLGSLQLDSLKGKLRPTRPTEISTQSFPLNLPADLLADDPATLSVQPASISLTIRLSNRSQLAGTVALNAEASIKDASRPVDLSRLPVPTLRPAEASGLSRDTIIELTESNSNLVDLIRAGASQLSVRGQVSIDTGETPVALSSRDRITGSVLASVPLSVIVKGQRTQELEARPLGLDAATRKQLEQGLVERVALLPRVENGLKIPLAVDLLISSQANPYRDTAALVKHLELGDGPETASVLELVRDEIPALSAAKTLGVRIRAGDGQTRKVTLRSTDGLRIQLGVALKVRIKPDSLGP
ncbi:MAG: hypothetical protein VKP72_05455 [bacterium]|nr:hypothetical protein [bacterium]